MNLCATILLGIAMMIALPCAAQDDDFERQRAEMLQRQRRVILNNDGGDAVVAARGPSAEGMLAARTIGLEDTHVDTIFYCTNRGTFSRHSHRSEVSETFTGTEGRFADSVVPLLIEQGTDPLQVMVEWCRENDMEIFWSERMNDRHDSTSGTLSEWKRRHPECLVGRPDEQPPNGVWTQVDYSHQAVRDQMFAIIEEVCRNYDVDGVEMDFFRHPCFFRTTAWGEQATDGEVAIMSGFVRRVREMAERVGRERGKPILIAIRVPDSVPLALAMGLDLEAWLAEGLVDIITGSGYFRMNPWGYLAELGHRHGALVYAGLSETRINADTSVVNRRSQQSYRARAASAWQAGVDGIYLFNMFNPRAGFLREIGDPEVLAGLEKTYFATVRGAPTRSYGNPEYWLAGGAQWRTIPILSPEAPLSVAAGEARSVPVFIGDDLAAARERGLRTEATCHVMAMWGASLEVRLNGQRLSDPQGDGPWRHFAIPDGVLRAGENVFEFVAAPDTGDEAGAVEWTADALPQSPWRHGSMREGVVFAELADEGMLIADRGTEQGDYLYFAFPWEADPQRPAVAGAEVKVIDGWNNLTVSNGVATERVTLYPDHIGTHFSGLRYEMDTTDGFHSYRVVVEADDIRIYVDGELRIDGEGMFTRDAGGRNDVAVGASNSPSTGEALWRRVWLSSPGTRGAQVYDLAVSVGFGGGQ
ncbi:MAG: family 10 glycosylhydrolase [Armatimonadota bacterium]|jgi:hypothetical protein